MAIVSHNHSIFEHCIASSCTKCSYHTQRCSDMGHCCVALMQDAVVVEELPRFELPALY